MDFELVTDVFNHLMHGPADEDECDVRPLLYIIISLSLALWVALVSLLKVPQKHRGDLAGVVRNANDAGAAVFRASRGFVAAVATLAFALATLIIALVSLPLCFLGFGCVTTMVCHATTSTFKKTCSARLKAIGRLAQQQNMFIELWGRGVALMHRALSPSDQMQSKLGAADQLLPPVLTHLVSIFNKQQPELSTVIKKTNDEDSTSGLQVVAKAPSANNEDPAADPAADMDFIEVPAAPEAHQQETAA